jgi:hypothetical protein
VNQPFPDGGLEGVLRFHKSREYERRDFELARLTLFVKNLQEIETSKHDLFLGFKKKLKRVRSPDGFFGLSFEINTAASLIGKQIAFTKSESPDFRIDNTPLAIEGSSVRIKPGNWKANLAYKISARIREKSEQRYCNPSVALFIDFTNLTLQSRG